MALDPERLLWQPDRKLISIPALRLVTQFALGDIITIGGQWRVDPLTGLIAESADELGRVRRILRQFIVTEIVEGHPVGLWPRPNHGTDWCR